ncbi:hypothetical protein BKA83DRAFT_4124422 [Pisolithus microcarpus]|nr:hypothetical protein BKA83DRAFT_4124422 [Pisolithus microcarpus]
MCKWHWQMQMNITFITYKHIRVDLLQYQLTEEESQNCSSDDEDLVSEGLLMATEEIALVEEDYMGQESEQQFTEDEDWLEDIGEGDWHVHMQAAGDRQALLQNIHTCVTIGPAEFPIGQLGGRNPILAVGESPHPRRIPNLAIGESPSPHKRGGDIPFWQLGKLHTHGDSPSAQLEIPHSPIKLVEKSHFGCWGISTPMEKSHIGTWRISTTMENLQLPDWRIPTPHRRHGEIPPWELGNLHTHGEIPHWHLESPHTHGDSPSAQLENPYPPIKGMEKSWRNPILAVGESPQPWRNPILAFGESPHPWRHPTLALGESPFPIEGMEKSHIGCWRISIPMENPHLFNWRIPTPHRRCGEIPFWQLGNLHTHGESPAA